MPLILSLPNTMPGKHYKKNFLSKVILRVGYTPMPPPDVIPTESELADRVKEYFPVVTGIPVAALLVNVTPTGSGVQQQIHGMQWEHRKVAGGTKVLFTTPDHISLEYGKGDFDHFPPFRSEFEAAFNAFSQLHPDIRITRIGLRYVNEIRFDEGNPLDWDNLINAQLIASVKAGIPNGAALVRSMHQLQVSQANLNLLLHYGIHNPEHPAPISRRQFVLDVDSQRNESVPQNEVMPTVISLNRMCETTFEACIDNGLRETLEPIND